MEQYVVLNLTALLMIAGLLRGTAQHIGIQGVAPHRYVSSLTGVVYPKNELVNQNLPQVDLWTTSGCTLCEEAVEVLRSVRHDVPHVLRLQDITDSEVTQPGLVALLSQNTNSLCTPLHQMQHRQHFREMKHEIPVIWINGAYWTKHRITATDAITALRAVTNS